MKILQISNYYYPHIGGIEQTSRDISQAVSGAHQVKVFCFSHRNADEVDVVDGIDIIRAKCFAKVASQSLSLSYGKRLAETFDEFHPDVVIFHYPNPFAAHFLKKQLKRFPGCKLVLWWHLDITKQKLLRIFFEGQSRWLLNRACKVIATSPNYIEGSAMLRSVKDKCTVIPSCFSEHRLAVTDEISARAEELRRQNEGKVICLAIGRHVKYKGIEYLIRASKLLDDNFVVWIGGEGTLTKKLQQLARGDNKVEFIGRLSDDELKSRLSACDIFCFPSVTKNEAFGLALAEAMAYGKPSVTFTINGSGVNFVSLNGVTGIEVHNGDAQEFASAINTLAEDKELLKEYGVNARKRAFGLFSSRQFEKNVNELISSL